MSRKKELANKRNALRSTGPKPSRKARSRLNAIKHGAYAQVCLEGEDVSRFKVLLLDLLAEYKPLGFEETLLVNEIAQTIWRKNRFKAAEALAINAYSFFKSQGEDQKGDVALAIAQDASACGTIPRCLAARNVLDRRLWGLFDRLRKLQKKRIHPWKSGAITEGANPGGVNTVLQIAKKSAPSDTSAAVNRESELRTSSSEGCRKQNDRDLPSPTQGPVPAENTEQTKKNVTSARNVE